MDTYTSSFQGDDSKEVNTPNVFSLDTHITAVQILLTRISSHDHA